MHCSYSLLHLTLPMVNCRPFASEVVFHQFLALFAIFYHWIKRNKCARENLPERSNNWWVYFIFSIAFIWKSTWRVKHCSLLINFFSHSMHWRNEMLGVVEHIQKIARTDSIKKILTGCVRVTETASHGEVVFILLELTWCQFSLATRHTSIELRQLSDYSLLHSLMEDKTFKIMTIYSVVILQNTERKTC